MGANSGWIQIRAADRLRVEHVLSEELAARGGRRIAEPGEARLVFALNTTGEWTTLIAGDDRLDFDLALRLAERLDALVFCSETVDAAQFRAAGLVGPGAAAFGRRMQEDDRLRPPDVLGELGFAQLGAEFVTLAFAGARLGPDLDWETVFDGSREDRCLLSYETEEDPDDEGDAEDDDEEEGSPPTPPPGPRERAFAGARYVSTVKTIGAARLEYGIVDADPRRWVFVATSPGLDLVFRVDARSARPARAWFDVQEAVFQAFAAERSRRQPRACLRVAGLSAFLEPDAIPGLHEVIFAPARAAGALADPSVRQEVVTRQREGREYALAAAEPRSTT